MSNEFLESDESEEFLESDESEKIEDNELKDFLENVLKYVKTDNLLEKKQKEYKEKLQPLKKNYKHWKMKKTNLRYLL